MIEHPIVHIAGVACEQFIVAVAGKHDVDTGIFRYLGTKIDGNSRSIGEGSSYLAAILGIASNTSSGATLYSCCRAPKRLTAMRGEFRFVEGIDIKANGEGFGRNFYCFGQQANHRATVEATA